MEALPLSPIVYEMVCVSGFYIFYSSSGSYPLVNKAFELAFPMVSMRTIVMVLLAKAKAWKGA